MLQAIVNKLKTGSISRVYPRGSVTVNPEAPYVVVWQDPLVPQPGYDNYGKNTYKISVHYQKGYINPLDDYIYNEVQALLHKQSLLTRDGRHVKIYCTGNVSATIEGNADGTISKERELITAGIYI